MAGFGIVILRLYFFINTREIKKNDYFVALFN